MESNGPKPLAWRRTRYHPFHLRANIKIDDLDMAALLLSTFRAAKMGNPSFSSTIAFMTNCPPAELRFRSELRGMGKARVVPFREEGRASMQGVGSTGNTELGREAEP